MAIKPYVSIILLTKNAGNFLERLLNGIFSSSCPFSFEVIAVDSSSTDSTREILLKYPVKLIEIDASSFSHGGTRNLAAEHSNGEILVFLTQDAIPRDNLWLNNLVDNFNDPDIAGVYGKQVPDKNASDLDKFFLSHVYPDDKIIKSSINPNDCLLSDIFFSNVNSAIRKSDWLTNPFDETLIMSEDQKWAKDMLLKKRKIVYDPSSVVVHCHNYTFSSIIRRNFDSGLSLKGIVNAPFKRVLFYEYDYLHAGFIEFLTAKKWFYIPLFLIYEATRITGFFLGFNSNFLSYSIKKFLSQNKVYWTQIYQRKKAFLSNNEKS